MTGPAAPAFPSVTGRGGRLDPDALAALEEERDFLLTSLDDLDKEQRAGDVDEVDYRTLRDDYTARAAEVLRAIEEGRSAFASVPATSPRRRVAVVVGVVLFAVLAGGLVMQASGRRGSGGLTGLDVTAASARFTECQAQEQEGDVDGALDCYTQILESLPANATVLAFRGWLQVREFDLAAGIDDLDASIQIDPGATGPYVFRASGRARAGDDAGAVADLATFTDNDPPDEETVLADQFAPVIVEAALDSCIDGDVTGSMPAVEVLSCYRDILTVDAGNPSASVYLGWLLARTGLTSEALPLLDDGLATDPPVTAGLVFRAAVRAHEGDVTGALADLERFDALDTPADQQAAAAQVRGQIESGQDPLAQSATRGGS